MRADMKGILIGTFFKCFVKPPLSSSWNNFDKIQQNIEVKSGTYSMHMRYELYTPWNHCALKFIKPFLREALNFRFLTCFFVIYN